MTVVAVGAFTYGAQGTPHAIEDINVEMYERNADTPRPNGNDVCHVVLPSPLGLNICV